MEKENKTIDDEPDFKNNAFEGFGSNEEFNIEEVKLKIDRILEETKKEMDNMEREISLVQERIDNIPHENDDNFLELKNQSIEIFEDFKHSIVYLFLNTTNEIIKVLEQNRNQIKIEIENLRQINLNNQIFELEKIIGDINKTLKILHEEKRRIRFQKKKVEKVLDIFFDKNLVKDGSEEKETETVVVSSGITTPKNMVPNKKELADKTDYFSDVKSFDEIEEILKSKESWVVPTRKKPVSSEKVIEDAKKLFREGDGNVPRINGLRDAIENLPGFNKKDTRKKKGESLEEGNLELGESDLLSNEVSNQDSKDDPRLLDPEQNFNSAKERGGDDFLSEVKKEKENNKEIINLTKDMVEQARHNDRSIKVKVKIEENNTQDGWSIINIKEGKAILIGPSLYKNKTSIAIVSIEELLEVNDQINIKGESFYPKTDEIVARGLIEKATSTTGLMTIIKNNDITIEDGDDVITPSELNDLIGLVIWGKESVDSVPESCGFRDKLKQLMDKIKERFTRTEEEEVKEDDDFDKENHSDENIIELSEEDIVHDEDINLNNSNSEDESIKISEEDLNKIENLIGIKVEDLKSIEGFGELSEGQQALVLNNMKQILLKRVKIESIQDNNKEMAEKGMIGRFFMGLKKSFDVRKKEKEKLSKVKKEGYGNEFKDVFAELVRGMKNFGPEAVVNNGKIEIQFATLDIELNEDERNILDKFNKISTEFSSLPDDWKHGKSAFFSGTEKGKFEKIELEYNNSKNELLLLFKGKIGDEGHSMIRVNDIEKNIKINQFLASNPEVDKALANISDKNVLKSVYDNIATERGAFFALGYAGRSLSAGVLGWVAAPAVAAVLGAYRGGKRGAESLEEKDILARQGKKHNIDIKHEDLEEKRLEKNIVDSRNLITRIESTIKQISEIDGDGKESLEKRSELLDKLKLRINFTEDKIKDSMVSYGEGKSSVIDMYSLLGAVREANVILLEHSTLNQDVEKRLERFLDYKEKEIGLARKKYISKKAAKGALYGVGFASAGALVREYFSGGGASDGGDNNGVNGKPVSRTGLDQSGVRFPIPDRPEPPVPSVKESDYSVFSKEEIATQQGIDATTEPGAVSENFAEKLELATIKKGDGVQNVLIRQLMVNPEKFGFEGDLHDTEKIKEWAGGEAHRIYLDYEKARLMEGEIKHGLEIRVTGDGVGKSAYILEKDAQGKSIVKEFIDGKEASIKEIEKFEYKHDYNESPSSATPIVEKEVSVNETENEKTSGKIPDREAIVDPILEEKKSEFDRFKASLNKDNVLEVEALSQDEPGSVVKIPVTEARNVESPVIENTPSKNYFAENLLTLREESSKGIYKNLEVIDNIFSGKILSDDSNISESVRNNIFAQRNQDATIIRFDDGQGQRLVSIKDNGTIEVVKSDSKGLFRWPEEGVDNKVSDENLRKSLEYLFPKNSEIENIGNSVPENEPVSQVDNLVEGQGEIVDPIKQLESRGLSMGKAHLELLGKFNGTVTEKGINFPNGEIKFSDLSNNFKNIEVSINNPHNNNEILVSFSTDENDENPLLYVINENKEVHLVK